MPWVEGERQLPEVLEETVLSHSMLTSRVHHRLQIEMWSSLKVYVPILSSFKDGEVCHRGFAVVDSLRD